MRHRFVCSFSLIVLALALAGVTPAVAQTPIQVSQSNLSFTGTAGPSGSVPPQSVGIINPPPAGVNFLPNVAWITVAQLSANLYEIRPNPATLSAGTYTATITVSTTSPGYSSATINVTLTLTGAGTGSGVNLSPSTLTFSYTGTQPTDQSVALSVSTGLSFFYNVQLPTYNPASTSWLAQVNSSSGSVVAGGSAQLTFRVNATGLVAGQYTATVPVQVASGATTTTSNLTVTLSVNQVTGSGATLTPSALTFSVPAAGTQVTTQSVNLSLSQSVAYTFQLAAPTYTPTVTTGWLQPQVGVGSASAGQTSVIPFSVNTTGLANGTYQANVTIVIIPQAGTSFQVSLPVTLLVGQGTGTGGAVLTPSSLTFNYQLGGTTPPSQTTTLSYGQNTGFQYNLTSLTYSPQVTSWLQALSLANGTVAAGQTVPLLFGINTLGLNNGQYTATVVITVQPFGGQQTTVSLLVTLNVGQVTTSNIQSTPAQLVFNYQQGGSLPGAQALAISPVSGGTASVTASATTTTGSGWLSVSPTSGSAPGILAVTVNPQNLSAGSYQGSVVVTSGSASTSVPVVLNVSGSAFTRANPASLVFYYTTGQSVPSLTQNLNLDSTGGSTQPITFQATTTSTPSWLYLSNPSQSLSTPFQMGVGVAASVAATMSAGTYTGTVNITNLATGVTINYPVTLVVSSSSPLLGASPSALSFTYTPTSGIPSAQSFNVTSSASALFFTPTVTYVNGANWLTVPTTQGVTGQPSGTLSVTVNPTGLADGVYAAYIAIAAPGTAGNTPLLVPVILTVGGTGTVGGSFGVTPSSLTFTQSQGSSGPPAQNLTVNGPSLPFTATVSNATTTSGITWLSVSPPSGTTPTTLTVSVVNSATLPQGTYTAFIVVAASGTTSTQVVQVTLNVTAPSAITLSPATMAFTASLSGSSVVNPPNQTLTLSSTLPGLVFTVSPTVQQGVTNWLSVTPTTGTTSSTPTTITVSVNATGLAVGTYNGSITVSAPGATNSPSIPVVLTVSQVNPPFISAVVNSASFAPGPIAAGEIISILGSNLGPAVGAGPRLTASGTVDTTLSGIKVSFSGLPSPLLFVRNDIINAIVPYSLAGRLSTRLVVENNGVQSQPIDLAMQNTAPGIYNLSTTGTGPNWAQNFPDFSINGPNNSIPRGGAVILYATGEGQTNPQGSDGVLATSTSLRKPIAGVTAKIGGVDAQVYYAGSVPTLVLGIMQVTLIVPNNAPVGINVPVEISVGGVVTQSGVTLSIR